MVTSIKFNKSKASESLAVLTFIESLTLPSEKREERRKVMDGNNRNRLACMAPTSVTFHDKRSFLGRYATCSAKDTWELGYMLIHFGAVPRLVSYGLN
ncbi:hypothetical protein E2C01_008340 [Portunus trituberculatus]|uniref:Uncharacterized protein n=1 Tax=Portunus trituberculatus TaxID=210409 RepID=A0A5B7D3N9_PORTR|nr:hypothetical protein [Portunus trituberculatus]